MSNISNVYSVVHPNKHGLVDFCDALAHYGNTLDSNKVYDTASSISKIFSACINAKKSKSRISFVFVDNSLFSFFSLCICKLFKANTFYYLHEPGGIGQKLYKGDPFIYSLFASFAEVLMSKLSGKILVPRFEALVFGDHYAPLLFMSNAKKDSKKNSRFIGFLGGRRKSRLEHIYSNMEKKLNKLGVKTGYFPSKEFGYSYAEKLTFLKRCDAVWNVYGVPYNQSGVTGDCIMCDVKCVVSQYEPFLDILNSLDLAVEVDIYSDEDQILESMLSIYEKKKNSLDDAERSKIRSEFGGALAFKKYWKKIFDLENK